MNIITGLYGKSDGIVEMYDQNGELIDFEQSKAKIGYCPQCNALYPSLTINLQGK